MEDTDDEGVFMISCTESSKAERCPPPVGDIDIEGTAVLALIDMGATVNVMYTSVLGKLKTRPIDRQTNAQIDLYGCSMSLAGRGVIDVTIQSGAKQV